MGNDYAKLMMEKVGLEQDKSLLQDEVKELKRLLFAMLDGFAWRKHLHCKCSACQASAYLEKHP